MNWYHIKAEVYKDTRAFINLSAPFPGKDPEQALNTAKQRYPGRFVLQSIIFIHEVTTDDTN